MAEELSSPPSESPPETPETPQEALQQAAETVAAATMQAEALQLQNFSEVIANLQSLLTKLGEIVAQEEANLAETERLKQEAVMICETLRQEEKTTPKRQRPTWL